MNGSRPEARAGLTQGTGRHEMTRAAFLREGMTAAAPRALDHPAGHRMALHTGECWIRSRTAHSPDYVSRRQMVRTGPVRLRVHCRVGWLTPDRARR
jgi:hypothetical protein